MRIVKILGGLGNQMFQYALAISLSKRYQNEIIKLDISAFKNYPLHNGYELGNIFKDIFPISTLKECARFGYPLPNYRLWQIGSRLLPIRSTMVRETSLKPYNPDVFNSEKKYFDGYWQSEEYFAHNREAVLRSFMFPAFKEDENIKLVGEMAGDCNVSLHIRRGDYLKIPLFKGICTKNYYKKSIRTITSMTHVDRFIVFSNDIQWVIENLRDDFENIPVVYVDWNNGCKSFRDMQLMSLCTHNIIANSSFSWWGAWLNHNPGKIVMAPSKWINIDNKLDILPPSWNRIDE